MPGEETCNDLDDDCDGETDENLAFTECGACGPCERTCWGPAAGCQDWGEHPGDRLVRTAERWLALEGFETTLHVIWPTSPHRQDVLRVDTRTSEIEAAFWTGPNHLDPGDNPHASAVDDDGNVVVANGGAIEWDDPGSLTKIAASEDSCPDANANGVVDTSRNWDDKLPFDAHDEWADECILWHTIVGPPDGAPRAVVLVRLAELDGPVERGWVGLDAAQQLLEFDPETGELTGREVENDFGIDAAAVDAEGFVWLVATAGVAAGFGRFDAADPEDGVEEWPLDDGGGWIIVDENDAPWVSPWIGGPVYRWDREDERFESVSLAGLEECGTGGGPIASDGSGSVWFGSMSGPCVYRIRNAPGDADDLTVARVDTPSTASVGTMAVDLEGRVWALGLGQGGATESAAMLIDVGSEETEFALDDCDGGLCLEHPWNRGDVTGLQRRNPLSSARWTGVASGCGEGVTDWKRIDVESAAPPGSEVWLSARTAPTLPELASAPWVELGLAERDGAELLLDDRFLDAGVSDSNLLEVRAVLRSLDHQVGPILHEVAAEWVCRGGIPD